MTTSVPRKALVGFDGREASRYAAQAACEMARQFGTQYEVLHVIDLPDLTEVGGRPDLMLQAEVEIETRTAEVLAGQLEELDPALTDHFQVRIGRPARVLLEYARESGVDTIVIGPHEKRGLFDLGSTTRGIVSGARCNLWVQPKAPRPIKRILVAFDTSEESRAALTAARDMARDLDASVTALYVFQAPDLAYAASPGYPMAGPVYAIDDVRKIAKAQFEASLDDFDWMGVEHEPRFVEGSPATVILGEQEGHDLIAMGTHGRTGLMAALLGGVAHSVIREARIPVYALRHPSRTWQLG